MFLNNNSRNGYYKKEYPMVRAISALSLLNLIDHHKIDKQKSLSFVKQHLNCLVNHTSKGYSGYAWGMNNEWVSKNGTYPATMPYITNTPYALEAFIKFRKLSNTNEHDELIKSVFNFIEHDLKIQLETAEQLALSYAPIHEPRIVINANSYAMYTYALLLDFYPDKKDYIQEKLVRYY